MNVYKDTKKIRRLPDIFISVTKDEYEQALRHATCLRAYQIRGEGGMRSDMRDKAAALSKRMRNVG